MENCQEAGCGKKAKMICACTGVLLCIKHTNNHGETTENHLLSSLYCEIDESSKSALVNQLHSFVKSTSSSLSSILKTSREITQKVLSESIRSVELYNNLQANYLNAIAKLSTLKKIKRNTKEPFEQLLLQNNIEKAGSLAPPSIAFPSFDELKFWTIETTPKTSSTNEENEKEQEIISHLNKLNHPMQITKYSASIKSSQNTEFQNNLLEIIKKSAKHPDLSTASSRAFTALSSLDYDFTNQDFSHAQLPNSVVTKGNFMNTNFCDCNLEGSKLNFQVLGPAVLNFKAFETVKNGLSCFKGHSSRIQALQFSTNNKFLVSMSENEPLRTWDLSNGHCMNLLKGHSDLITCFCINPENTGMITGSEDCSICFWDFGVGYCTQIFEEHKAPIACLAFTSDGQNITSGDRLGQFIVRNLHGELVLQCQCKSEVSCIAVPLHSTEAYVLFASNSDLRLKKINNAKFDWACTQAHDSRIVALGFAKKAQVFISASEDFSIFIWGTMKGKLHSKLAKELGRTINCWKQVKNEMRVCKSLRFAKNFKYFVTIDDAQLVKIWRTKNLEVIAERAVDENTNYVEISANGTWVAYNLGNCISVCQTDDFFKLTNNITMHLDHLIR